MNVKTFHRSNLPFNAICGIYGRSIARRRPVVLRGEKRVITDAAVRGARTLARFYRERYFGISLPLVFARAACAPPGLSRGLSTVWHITRDARSGLRGRTGRTGGATLGAGPHSAVQVMPPIARAIAQDQPAAMPPPIPGVCPSNVKSSAH